MATLQVKNLTKNFGPTQVLKQINIDISDGEFLVLLGPSGCGKSTLLNIIAGLETVNEGEVRINDHVVNKVEPKDRNIAMVFQSYALYPSMTVRDNILFGLKQRKTPQEEMENSLQHFSKMLKVDHLLQRKPGQLSGGQRQRVAMGRALVRKPEVFLFDEPLSNLDAKLRVEMRHEIKKLHEQLGTTMIYVTHDQVEAMSLATRIAVMDEGIVQQIDSPEVVYDRPESVFVADFVGSPSINMIPGKLVVEGSLVAVVPDAQSSLKIPVSGYEFREAPQSGTGVLLGLRPECLMPQSSSEQTEFQLSLPVSLIELTGHEQNITFNFYGAEIVSRLPRGNQLKVGDVVPLNIDLGGVSIFDSTSRKRI
jgi:multiple sugar transport system ATP-binding protein